MATDTAISMVYPIMKAIVNKGFNADGFCQFASFDANLLLDADARIAGTELERLMLAAAEYTGDDYFGLHQGQITEFADLGIVGYVMMHSNTVVDALSAYQRYNVILSSGFNLDWSVRGEEIEIRMFLPKSGKMSRHCAEDMSSSVHRLIERLSNRRVPLHGVQFMHAAPRQIDPYIAVFGVTPQFDAACLALRYGKEVLGFPVLYSDAKFREIFEAKAEETRSERAGAVKFADRVARWMMQCFPARFPTLQQTAEAFFISARTLQSKLKEENTSYNELSVRVRRDLAIRYLKKQEYSVGDIAYALHFSEQSTFQNAFKKWTGLTPGQYRARVKQGLPSPDPRPGERSFTENLPENEICEDDRHISKDIPVPRFTDSRL